jgi:hypothetical protein
MIGVTATQDSTFEWREFGAQVTGSTAIRVTVPKISTNFFSINMAGVVLPPDDKVLPIASTRR